MTRAEIDWLHLTVQVKVHVFRNVFGGTFFRLLLTESLTASTLSGHLAVNFPPDLWFSTFLLRWFTGPVVWNFFFLGNFFFFDNCQVKLPTKICLYRCEWFCLQISSGLKYFFLSCSRHCGRGVIVVIVCYFQIWNKKEHSISCKLRHPV